MMPNRGVFAQKVCYTPLVFERFNKKLQTKYSEAEIKELVQQIIHDPQTQTIKQGKNYYLSHKDIELVINSFNYRLITANKK